MMEISVNSPRKIASGVLAFLLWAGTAIVGLYAIVIIREMVFRIYARLMQIQNAVPGPGFEGHYSRSYWQATTLGMWAVFFLALAWIALFIGGAEYHYKHVGQPRSWKLFGWTMAGEIVILAAALII